MARISLEKTTSSQAVPARLRKFVPALVILTAVWPLAAEANVDCVERMSRVPMAGYAPIGGGAPMRAMTARAGIRPATAATPRTKVRATKATRAKAAVVRPRGKGPRRVAATHRSRPKIARAAAPRPAAAPVRAPTPMAVAAADLGRPAFALIGTTICESRPVIASNRAYALLGGPPLAAAPIEAPQGAGVRSPGTTFFPPDLPLEPGLTDGVIIGNPGTPPVFPPTPPIVPPGTTPETPVTPPGPPTPPTPPDGENPLPPVIPPPPTTGPPTTPPGEPPGQPPVQPPGQPPTAVPEPQTWALMLTGFGLIGGILRRGKRSLASRS